MQVSMVIVLNTDTNLQCWIISIFRPVSAASMTTHIKPGYIVTIVLISLCCLFVRWRIQPLLVKGYQDNECDHDICDIKPGQSQVEDLTGKSRKLTSCFLTLIQR